MTPAFLSVLAVLSIVSILTGLVTGSIVPVLQYGLAATMVCGVLRCLPRGR